MHYQNLRSVHFSRVSAERRRLVERFPREAERAHAALIRRAAAWGAGRILRDRAGFARAVRSDLGIGSWFAPLFQAILVRLFQALLPIVIAWLESQLAQASVDPTAGSLDARLQALAKEAGQ